MKKTEFINECLEYKYRVKQIRTILAIALLFGLLLLPLATLDDNKYLFILLLLIVIYMPFIVYNLSEKIKIAKNFEKYVFYQVKFDKINTTFRRNTYFTIKFNHNGKVLVKDTRHLFTSVVSLISYQLEDFINKDVLIAYNQISDQVVVVKLVNE